MDANSTRDRDEAQEILDALRKVQQNPELQAEAAKDPDGVADRLGVSDLARHAVAFGLTAMVVGVQTVYSSFFLSMLKMSRN